MALNHAMSAVILLQEMMLRKKLDPSSAAEDDLEEVPTIQNKDTNKDKVAVLAIAYHNMGVEQEFLRSYPAAILSYKKAVNFAEKNLGAEDGITQNLRSVYENAKNEVSKQIFYFGVHKANVFLFGIAGHGSFQKEEGSSRRKSKRKEAYGPTVHRHHDARPVWKYDNASQRLNDAKHGACRRGPRRKYRRTRRELADG